VQLELEEATRGEFEIQRELGRGGMAAVFLARDLALGRKVAIKVMAPGLLTGPGMIDRFRQEAVTVANLLHPNIVTIHTVRQEGSLHFFVMQLVEGASLEEILARAQPIPVPLVQAILYQLGVGLSYAHRRGVIHRDIKPANVLLDQEGNAILTDFGIAKVTTASHLTQTGSTMGTPAYMSPEQCRAAELTGASDQYSLGILAYEMLTGRPPFAGSPFEVMQAHTAADPADIRALRPDCPVEMESAVSRMLAKDPKARFANVADAIEALGGWLPGPQDPVREDLARLVRSEAISGLSGRGPLAPHPEGTTPPGAGTEAPGARPPGRRRSRALPWAAGLVAVAGVAMVGVLSRDFGEEGGPGNAPPGLPTVGSVAFADATVEVPVGGTVHVRADLRDPGGSPLTDQPVRWSSTDPGIATVEGSSEEARVVGVSPGAAEIVARAGEAEGRFQVRVPAPAVGELTVSAPAPSLMLDARMALSALLTDETGARVGNPELRWTSSDPAVLEVDPGTGVVTGRSPGRAQVTVSSGNRTRSVTLEVVGRVDGVTVRPPPTPLRAGATAVLRASTTSRPAGYLPDEGLRWSSSNPSVASVSFSRGDSAILTLLGPGETVLSAQAGAARDAITIRVEAPATAVTVELSPSSVTFRALEGGDPPESRIVQVTVSGNEDPALGTVAYGSGAGDWLVASLGPRAGERAEISLRVDVSGLPEGRYSATLPVEVGEARRLLTVDLEMAENPATAPVEPNAAAEAALSALLTDYVSAINEKDLARIREIFPSVSQGQLDEVEEMKEGDTILLQLVPRSLRPGSAERTLEGDVAATILGRDESEAFPTVYTFGRGEGGWYIVSWRAR
jgi:serine/threonine-protein kinase